MERPFLGRCILPTPTDTVPAGNGGAARGCIILCQVPAFDDIAEILHIGVAGGIAAILDDLHSLLVIRAQTRYAYLGKGTRTNGMGRLYGLSFPTSKYEKTNEKIRII